jgi:hypothetical protein
MTIPITLLKAESRTYKNKDGVDKTYSYVNTIIEGEVVELSASPEMVKTVQDRIGVDGGSVEVDGDIQISERSFAGKKYISVRLKAIA